MKHRAIAICGLIGSGKSTVASYLVTKGYNVIDCDDIARELSQDSDIIAKVHNLLGDASINDGTLNRQYIRSVVFDDITLHHSYSQIFTEAVESRVLDIIASCALVFVQLPIFDAIHYQWHAVWNVVSDDSVRIARTVARDNTSIEDVQTISSRQHSVEGADTIYNCGTIQQLHDNVDILLATL